MTVEQTPFRTQDWNFPSPSSTPTSSDFQDHLLQTPKTAPSPSHFLDAFSTPQVNTASISSGTPLFSFDSPEYIRSNTQNRPPRSPEDPSFHVNHFSQNSKLLPVEPSRRLTSSPNSSAPPVGTRDARSKPSTTSKVPSSSTMDSSQIQTPPPTRDSSSRRKHGQSQSVYRNITPATTGHRAATTTVENSQTSFTSTPVQFPSLQFSPDAMPFYNTGPLTAPVYPQRLFWDQSPMNQDMGMNVNLTDDPFGTTPGRNNSHFEWPLAAPANQMPMQFPNLTPQDNIGITNQDIPFSTTTTTSGPTPLNSSLPTQQEQFSTTSGVDPAMLFSFNESFDMIGPSEEVPGYKSDPERPARRPYEQQTRESERERQERELARQRKQQQHSRTSTNSSSATSGQSSRPSMQRSKTESTIRRDPAAFTRSRTPISSGQPEQIPRKSSPLKRLSSQSTLTAIPETIRSRPRTRLVIDESGNARTETYSPFQGREDKTPQPNYRTQYPGLWDDDDTSEEEQDRPVSSRTNSFAFPAPPARPSSKHARDSLGKSGSAKKARPSSFISLSKAFEKPGPDELSNSLRRYSMSSFGESFGQASDSAVVSPTESQGDAQNALKAMREGRLRTQERAAQSTLKAHNQRWSQAAVDLSKLAYADPFTSSPITLPSNHQFEFTTPSTGRSSRSADSTRCICNTVDGEGLMIQCESCTKWLHANCVGIHPQHVPSVYLCTFCTGNTPAARGGRAREPMRAPVNTYTNTSPLIHKSTYRR